MARPKINRKGLDWKQLLGEEKELFKNAIQEVVQEVLEAEMDETVGAHKGNARRIEADTAAVITREG